MNYSRYLSGGVVFLLLMLSFGWQYLQSNGSPADSGQAQIRALYETRQSDVQVLAEGRVSRLLNDDNQGSRHQRLIVEISPGFTILIAHNIDLAPRVPARRGDLLSFYGEYEWNQRGGVVHWTHHDPGKRHVDGWIELNGKRYQ